MLPFKHYKSIKPMYLNQDKVFSTSKADVFFMSFDMAKPLQEYLLNNKERLIPCGAMMMKALKLYLNNSRIHSKTNRLFFT